jgi:hypothetical protein
LLIDRGGKGKEERNIKTQDPICGHQLKTPPFFEPRLSSLRLGFTTMGYNLGVGI